MSESAFPLAPQGGAAAAHVEEAESGDKRRMYLLAGVAALLVLVVAAYFLFIRGGSSDDSSASGVVASANHHAPNAATKPAAKAAAPVTKTVPSTFNNVLSRDPFKPLYVPVPPPPPVTAAAPAGTTSTTSTASSSSTPVTLVKVYTKSGQKFAQTKVGSAVYNSAVGQTFGGTFQLLAVNGTAATYVQGDEQFSLSVGQVVLK